LEKDEVYNILSCINIQCGNNWVYIKTLETKAEACIKMLENDSALWYTRHLLEQGYDEPTGLLIRAQAYDNLGICDSALFYANRVLECSDFYGDRFNALYILTHNDSTINTEEILNLTSDRTDIQMDYTEVRANLSQAIQLLDQELNRKPNLTWLWAILVTLLVIGVPSSTYISHKRRKRQLVSQQVNDLLQKHDELSARTYLLEQKLSQRQKKMLFEIESFCKTIQNDSDLKKKLSWNDFDKMCAVVDERMYGLATKLKERYNMDLNNLRLCILITIGNFTNSEMADLLSYDEHTFRTIKNRVARNLNISGKNMRDFFLNLMIGS